MPNRDQLLQAIGAIHTASLDETLWPAALSAIVKLCGGGGGTLEIFDKAEQRHSVFHSVDVPISAEQPYIEYWASRSPRVSHGLRQKAGDISYDYQILDEAGIDRDEFYCDMLRPLGFRYFVSTTPTNNRQEFSAVAVQRTRRQGHVGDAEIDLMCRLNPHIQIALDVAARLRMAGRAAETLEQSIEWLEDGVAQAGSDGRVVFCNAVFSRLAADLDGIRIERGAIVFGDRSAQARFKRALAAISRAGIGDTGTAAFTDFTAARPSGAPAYVVSLRPLPAESGARRNGDAGIAVFIKDPASPNDAAQDLLRKLFGLTPAEAALAHAMQQGVTPVAYARDHALSRSTVYTHLCRLKDKIGRRRADELGRKFGELRVSARSLRRGPDVT